MPIEFKLPEVAEGVESADVAEIHVAEGDTIEADQVVMEIETEKAAVELPCPHAGKVTKVHVSQGQTVSIGAVLLTIEESVDAGKATSKAPAPSEEAEESAKKQPPKQQEAETEQPSPKPQAAEGVAEPTVDSPAEAPKRAPAPSDGDGRSTSPAPAGPATRRLARKLGVDLHQVPGSGPGGRITSEDVEAYVRQVTSGTAISVASAQAPVLTTDFSKFGPVQQQPLNKIARTSADRLTTAWQTVPHVTQHDLVDVTELETARKRFVKGIGASGPKVTMTAIMVKAVVSVLKAFPHFNASLDPQHGTLILKQYFHIGVAVDTDAGLLVPVIRDADRKTILQIAGDLIDLAERARERKLDLSEMQGGTFTITNLGGIGGTAFTPIVNYPEVAILGVSRSQKQLKLVNGAPEERLMLPLSLSYDHRVVNGADAARFVVKLGQTLADQFQLLVEC